MVQEYLELLLHRSVLLEERSVDKLPLIYRNAVRLYTLRIDAQECVLIELMENMPLTELRKCYRQITRILGVACALYLHSMTYYAKDALLQEGIPFVWEGRLMYLPFIGTMLSSREDRQLKPCTQISFLTQKLLLKSLYEGWQGINVSQAAQAMNVTKTSITRCFDEIDSLALPVLKVKNRARKLFANPDKQAMWNMIRPVLRSPIIRTFSLTKLLPTDLPLSGLSALAAQSMLADNSYPTVAFEKSQMRALNVTAWKQVPPMEQPACVAHEIGYVLSLGTINAIDPLSVVLMLTDDEKADPRVEKAINEMLEAYVW